MFGSSPKPVFMMRRSHSRHTSAEDWQEAKNKREQESERQAQQPQQQQQSKSSLGYSWYCRAALLTVALVILLSKLIQRLFTTSLKITPLSSQP